MKLKTILYNLLTVLLVSCASPQKPQESSAQDLGENLMRHARNVAVYETPYGHLMEIRNPWDSTEYLGRFALVNDSASVETMYTSSLPAGITPVKIPVQSVVSFSATQWSVFMRLGEIGRVKGILEGRYVHDSIMQSMLASGEMCDLGTEAAIDCEKLIQLQPDIILYSPYFDGNQNNLKISDAVLFPFADYLENTPLGRAEWIRVIGLLSGCQHEADAWFDTIEMNYNALKDNCSNVSERPSVFSDLAFNGQWYIAGGKSYIAKLFSDAGADYIWKDNDSPASFPLDPEAILAKAQHADFWRIANSSSASMTYNDLERENPIYPLFDACKNRKVIVCDIRKVGYFENSQIEPDILLADFIYFFHPECLTGKWSGYQPKYYHWLDEN